MDDRLHPATRAVIEADAPDTGLAHARTLATSAPPGWDQREWLTIASALSTAEDPRWLAVKAFAHEQQADSTAAVMGLWARARLIAALGADPSDEFRSLSAFTERAEAFVAQDVPDAALEAYTSARSTIFTVAQGEPAWLRARDTFLRCRALRDFARAVLALGEEQERLPPNLQQWKAWAHLREEDSPLPAQ
jgi:hypothetical protein